jgi:hypothetical protein
LQETGPCSTSAVEPPASSWRNSSPFSADEDTFANSLLWKNLLLRTCSALLWEGERCGRRVAVWGGK